MQNILKMNGCIVNTESVKSQEVAWWRAGAALMKLLTTKIYIYIYIYVKTLKLSFLNSSWHSAPEQCGICAIRMI